MINFCNITVRLVDYSITLHQHSVARQCPDEKYVPAIVFAPLQHLSHFLLSSARRQGTLHPTVSPKIPPSAI